MSKIAERLRLLADRAGGMRELSIAAGLSENHLATYLQRLRIKPDAELRRATLVSIAKAGGVTVEWLLGDTDVGTPPPTRAAVIEPRRPDVEYPDRYPSRAVVVALIRRKTDPAIIDALLSISLDSESDPGEEYWWSEARRLKRKLETWQAEQETEIEPEDGDRMP